MADVMEAIATDSALQAPGPVLRLTRSEGFFEFDREQCKAAGKALHNTYVSNEPFPHIAMDNFLDIDVLRQVNAEFPEPRDGRFSDAFSQLKTGYSLGMIRSAYIHDLLSALNSPAFLAFLEAMTGIRGLVTDNRFNGGGLHETRRGGHLSIHADFNTHPHTKLRRRLNLILFLNENWEAEWGGALELWDKSMTACRESVLPVINRAVVFNTDTTSYHGHPDPLNTPPDITRRSIALYYYTVPRGMTLPHTTIFRARPGSRDANTSIANRVIEGARYFFGKRSDS